MHQYSQVIVRMRLGEAAQVDFGTGLEITDVYTGEVFATRVFIMTLACSRHQYVELVCDQKVATGLGGGICVVKSQIHAGGRGAGRFRDGDDKGGGQTVKTGGSLAQPCEDPLPYQGRDKCHA